MRPDQLLSEGLDCGLRRADIGETFLTELDHYAAPALLRMLSGHSGVPAHRLRAMTLARWVAPIAICKGVRPKTHRPHYSAYIRGFRVLPKVGPGADLKRPALPWAWCSPGESRAASCMQCTLADEIPYQRITWQFQLTQTCPIHSMRLFHEQSRPWLPGTDKVALHLDWMTTRALQQGSLALPSGRRISAALWLRFVRSILDEVMRAEEHHWEGFLCSEAYDHIWAVIRKPTPKKAVRWHPYESESFAFPHVFHHAAAALVMLLLERQLPSIAGRRSRQLFAL